MKEYKNKCGLSKLYTVYENESNIKYYKNTLELTIMNILYKNINVNFTNNKLFYELQKKVIRLPFIILNDKDIFIIFCFIWHQLINQKNTFINYNNNTIKLNMRYYSNNTLEFDKLLENNNIIDQLSYKTLFINEQLYEIESYEDVHSKIYISYFINHLLHYKEIYIESQFIKEFITMMITNNIEYITDEPGEKVLTFSSARLSEKSKDFLDNEPYQATLDKLPCTAMQCNEPGEKVKTFSSARLEETQRVSTNKNKLINKINNIIADDTNTHEICELITLDDIIDKLIAKINYYSS
jgi:hypothetical protein